MIGALLFLLLAVAFVAALRILGPMAVQRGRRVAAGLEPASRPVWQFAGLMLCTLVPLCFIVGASFAPSGQRATAGLVLTAMSSGILTLSLYRRFARACATKGGTEW